MNEPSGTQYWHVRLTLPHENEPKILDWLQSLKSPFAVSLETARNEHFHIIMQITDKKAHKDSLDRLGVPRGNSGRSTTRLREDLPTSLAYVIKDGNYHIDGFDSEIIDRATELVREFQLKIKQKKMSKLEQLREIIKRDLKITKLDDKEIYVFQDTDGERIVNEEFILDIVLEFYKNSKTLYREFYVISVVQTLCLEFVPSYDYKCRNRILEKI